jgi:hypothetical protein
MMRRFSDLRPGVESVPVQMAGQRRLFDIIHSRPFQRPVGEVKASRLDNIDAEREAGGGADDRAGVARDVRLVKGDAEFGCHCFR